MRNLLARSANATISVWLVAMALLGMVPGIRAAESPFQEQLDRGRLFLKSMQPPASDLGELALSALALIKAGEPVSDPAVSAMIGRIKRECVNSQVHETLGIRVYVIAVSLMALAAADPQEHAREIEQCAQALMRWQQPNGAWNYPGALDAGDTSQTQYAILGLWEATAAGVDVPDSVWDRAMHWLLLHQDVQGGFSYHPLRPSGNQRIQQPAVTDTMSIAGAGSLLICQSQLGLQPARARQGSSTRTEKEQPPLLIRVNEQAQSGPAEVAKTKLVSQEAAEQGIRLATAHIQRSLNFQHPTGTTVLYYFYGVERFAALARLTKIGEVDWYAEGGRILAEKQLPTGGWHISAYGVHDGRLVDTAFALLFLGRSTAKSVERIRIAQLGRGTLLGGRGLPTAEPVTGEIGIRRRTRYAWSAETPVDNVLAAIAEPSLLGYEETVAIESLSPRDLARSLEGQVPRLRELARSTNPDLRRAALAALARSRDLRVAPLLIDALEEDDAETRRVAYEGLRLLGQQMEGFGYRPEAKPSSAGQKQAIAAWRRWFADRKMEIDPDQRFVPTILFE